MRSAQHSYYHVLNLPSNAMGGFVSDATRDGRCPRLAISASLWPTPTSPFHPIPTPTPPPISPAPAPHAPSAPQRHAQLLRGAAIEEQLAAHRVQLQAEEGAPRGAGLVWDGVEAVHSPVAEGDQPGEHPLELGVAHPEEGEGVEV